MKPGICPYCSGKLTETRTDARGKPSESGTQIKTTCSQCKAFIGYRPVKGK